MPTLDDILKKNFLASNTGLFERWKRWLQMCVELAASVFHLIVMQIWKVNFYKEHYTITGGWRLWILNCYLRREQKKKKET